MTRLPSFLMAAASLGLLWTASEGSPAHSVPVLLVLAVLAAFATAWPCVGKGPVGFTAGRIAFAALFATYPVITAGAAALSGLLAGTALLVARNPAETGTRIRSLLSRLLPELVPLLLLGMVAAVTGGVFRLPAIALACVLLVLGDTAMSYVLRDGPAPGVAGTVGRYALMNALAVPVALVLAETAAGGGLGPVTAVSLPVAAYSLLMRNREELVAVQRWKTSELSAQNELVRELTETDSTSRLIHLLDVYLAPDGDSGDCSVLLSRLPGGAGWLTWTREDRPASGTGDLPVDPPAFNDLSDPVSFMGRQGVFLGLSENRDLLLFVSLATSDRLVSMPRDIRQNLVLLLGRSWQVTGHHVRSEESFLAAAVMLARLVDSKDDYTHGHSLRVADLACAIGRRLGLGDEEMKTLRVGALLHDLGKIAIDSEILTKRGLLTTEERSEMERHSAEGAAVVRRLRDYDQVADIILRHHEKLDGSGYPSGRRNTEIPFLARIVTVADTFDAITSTRSYHALIDQITALDTIHEGRGVQFDARVVDALSDIIRSNAADDGGEQHGA